jgi:hypothetical protein
VLSATLLGMQISMRYYLWKKDVTADVWFSMHIASLLDLAQVLSGPHIPPSCKERVCIGHLLEMPPEPDFQQPIFYVFLTFSLDLIAVTLMLRLKSEVLVRWAKEHLATPQHPISTSSKTEMHSHT